MRRSKLIPEVAAMLASGALHEYDAEWVGRLRPEHQLAAAMKCQRPNPTFDAAENARARIGGRARGSDS